MTNSMRVEFPNLSDNERFARTVAGAFVVCLDPTMDELAEIKTAVSEAVTNAIIHGYEDRSGIITLEGTIYESTVEFSVSDFGKGIGDIRRAMTPLYTGMPGGERAGMGFTIMEAFMDTVSVESEKGKGTRVTMTKNLADRSDSVNSETESGSAVLRDE